MSLGSRFQGNKSSLLKIDSHYLHLCVGAIVGALVGDCLGSYWEIGSWVGTHPIHLKQWEPVSMDCEKEKISKRPSLN